MAVTALSWRRHVSAQMIVKPVAIAGTCGARKARPAATIVTSSSGQSRFNSTAPGRCSGSVVVARADASSREMAGVDAGRRPRYAPSTEAATHHPAASRTSRASALALAPMTEAAARVVAAAALTSTVLFKKSVKRTCLVEQRLEERPHALGSVHREVGLLVDLRRSLVGAHPHAETRLQLAFLHERAQAQERVDVRDIVANVDGGAQPGLAHEAGDRPALVEDRKSVV